MTPKEHFDQMIDSEIEQLEQKIAPDVALPPPQGQSSSSFMDRKSHKVK